MSKIKLICGDDNGSCSLWDITLAEYEDYRERLNELEEEDNKEAQYEKLEKEWRGHEIKIDTQEYGYIPDYVMYLAEELGIDTDSN